MTDLFSCDKCGVLVEQLYRYVGAYTDSTVKAYCHKCTVKYGNDNIVRLSL